MPRRPTGLSAKAGRRLPMRNAQRAKALRLTLPVMCGYLFLGFAFG